jgi:hypothetical protein
MRNWDYLPFPFLVVLIPEAESRTQGSGQTAESCPPTILENVKPQSVFLNGAKSKENPSRELFCPIQVTLAQAC